MGRCPLPRHAVTGVGGVDAPAAAEGGDGARRKPMLFRSGLRDNGKRCFHLSERDFGEWRHQESKQQQVFTSCWCLCGRTDSSNLNLSAVGVPRRGFPALYRLLRDVRFQIRHGGSLYLGTEASARPGRTPRLPCSFSSSFCWFPSVNVAVGSRPQTRPAIVVSWIVAAVSEPHTDLRQPPWPETAETHRGSDSTSRGDVIISLALIWVVS